MTDSAAPASPTPTPAPAPAPDRRRLRNIIVLAVAVAGLLWTAQFLYHYWRYEETDDAYVAGHVHQISAQADGQVAQVLVHENQRVDQGDVLIRLDPLVFQIARQKAQAQAAQAADGIAEARAAEAQAAAHQREAHARLNRAEAEAAQARAQANLARLTLQRDRSMSVGADRAVTPADLDTAQAAFDAAQAGVKAAQDQVAAMEAGIGTADAESAAAAAQERTALAGVAVAGSVDRDAERRADYAEIRAPAAGVIGDRNVETGNRVQTGEQLFVLVEPVVWIEANFKETQLARMREGQPADVEIDAVPGKTFHGRVESIAPASGAEYALLPADNATGNFTKVVQRVPVRIALDPAEIAPFAGRLRPGLSAVVSVLVR